VKLRANLNGTERDFVIRALWLYLPVLPEEECRRAASAWECLEQEKNALWIRKEALNRGQVVRGQKDVFTKMAAKETEN